MSIVTLDKRRYDLSNTEQREAYWNAYATKNLTGKKIINVRYMSQAEMDALGWHSRALVIQLDDGTLIYPSQDDEGNNAGALFGQTKNGGRNEDLTFPVL
jgi:hypothetical protein